MATRSGSGKKQDRSTLPTVAAILGCVVSAYGFSKGNPWLQWILPVGMVVVAFVVAFWPRRGAGGSSGGASV